jgi:hypothetical protein
MEPFVGYMDRNVELLELQVPGLWLLFYDLMEEASKLDIPDH